MKRLVFLVTALTAACTAAGQAGGLKGDKAKLQGTWEVVSVFAADKDITPKSAKRMTLTFKGDKIASRLGEEAEEGSTYSLDETKRPPHLTVAKTAKQKEMKAIYQVAGDVLKIALPPRGPGGDRPEALNSKEVVLLTLKRVKK